MSDDSYRKANTADLENSLEQGLDPSKFLRIHRSRIVRTSCIVELKTMRIESTW